MRITLSVVPFALFRKNKPLTMLISNLFSFRVTVSLVIVLFTTLIVHIVKYLIKTYRRDPRLVKFAETIPGPPETSIFGSYADFFYGDDSLTKASKYLEKYGHVYKVWFGKHLVVGLSKLEDIQAVFLSSKMMGKPEMMATFDDFWGDSLFSAPVEMWKVMRKKLTPSFNNNRFERYATPMNDKIRHAIKILEKQVDGPEFDFWDTSSFLTFNIVTKVLLDFELDWGHPLSINFHHSMSKGLVNCYQRMCLPWFHMKFLSDLVYKKQIVDLQTKIYRFANTVLENKMSFIKNEISLHKDNPDNIPRDEIPPKSYLTNTYELLNEGYAESVVRDEIIGIISAGTNTSASTLCFAILLIAIHQDVQAKMYDELYEVFGDSDRDTTYEDTTRLPYMDQVLKETVRRFPLLPYVMRDVQEDCKIGDRIFPKGTVVMVSIMAVHLNPEYYPDPWKFNPDNFSPEAIQKRPKLAYIPFSVGARNCIGGNFGLFEVKMILSAFLRKFSFHTSMTMDTLKMNTGIVIDVLNGYNVSVKSRVRKPSYLQ